MALAAKAKKMKLIRVGGVAAALGLLGVLGLSFAGGKDDAPAHAPELALSAATKAAAPAPLPKAPPLPPAAAPPAGPEEFFKIEHPAQAKSCEQVLGKAQKDFAKKAKWKGAQAWKLARRSLMAGNADAANAQMCESAFIDAKGPATAGLVKYYLSRRALDEAHAWAKRGVASHSGSGRAEKELLADVLSQMGQMDEARRLWLDSFKLTQAQRSRLEAVCRNFVKSAQKAHKGGDSPLAERLLRRAAAFTEDDPVIAAELATTLLKNGQPALAKRWAKRALAKDPSSALARSVLSQEVD